MKKQFYDTFRFLLFSMLFSTLMFGQTGDVGPTLVISSTPAPARIPSRGPRSRANPFAWHLINKKAFTIFDKKKK